MELSLWLDLDLPEEKKTSMDTLVEQVHQAVESAVAQGLDKENYHIILASEDLIRQLNRDFRGNDAVTDVLSFPLGYDDEVTGEIYICWSRVTSQAQEYGHTWQREFCYLLVHGILHLLGYEHGEEPCPEMRAMEEKVLQSMELRR